MSSEYVTYEKRDAVAWITLNRPTVLNALTLEMIETIGAYTTQARDDESVRVLVFTGTGRGFCSGFDIEVFQTMSFEEVWRLARTLNETWSLIRTLSKPTIAAINGVAAGGGFELALVCDLRIAATTAWIGSCEVRINQPTTNGSSYLLARLIGESKAKELCLTGDIWEAREAARFGLVNAMAEPEDLTEEVTEWAERVASRAPIAVSFVKGFFERGRQISADTAVSMEEEAAIDCYLTEDQKEGFSAFIEKRKANWQGR